MVQRILAKAVNQELRHSAPARTAWPERVVPLPCCHAHRGGPRPRQGHPVRPVHADRGVHPHPAARRPYRLPRPDLCGYPDRRRRRVHPAAAMGPGRLGRRRHDHPARRQAAANGTRIASICSGAFILAATGLLDGHRATTHWLAAALLAELHPAIDVDPDVLYVDNGQLLTSAGAAAGLDLCLHLIRRDHGSAVAADAARLSVMPLEREGGQAQFIVHDQPPTPRGSILEPVLRWMEDNCGKDLTLDDMATHAGMSTRTLNRRFREQTGTTPTQWLLRIRIRQAQYLLEATDRPVDRIASQVGFGSPTAFRDRFKRIVGTSPNAYRAAFHTPGAKT